MTNDEAHARLDALQQGLEDMTAAEIREALLATGDLQRKGHHYVVQWPFIAEELEAA